MTETTARIRWDDAPARTVHAAIGYVGTISEPAFHIYGPTAEESNWLLSVRIAAGSRFVYADGPDALKAEAERWLERFVSSLGASFPEPVPPHPEEETGR